MNAFFECIKKAIATISKDYGITPGCVAVFQTHGKGLSYKPHVHCALTAGGITAGMKWMKLGSVSYTRLAQVVRDNLKKELLKKNISGDEIPEEHEINNREWSVYATCFEHSAEKIIGYLSHTANGVVINLNKGIEEDTENGTVQFTENHTGKQTVTTLDKKLFVERYLNHIPVPHTVTVRYYGLYSNQFSTQLEKLQEQFPIDIDYEGETYVDHCPECHAPMKIIRILDPYEKYEDTLELMVCSP
jgi:hypothetical protein